MTYIDYFLTPVPRANRAQYEKLAAISSRVVREYGALRVVESWLDESESDESTYHADSACKPTENYGTIATLF